MRYAMATRDTTWPPGTPCWIDIMAGDLERTKQFYAAVLGWDYTASDPAYGGYSNALVGGRLVAGMSPTMPGMEDAPHVWTVYLATDDIAATAETALAGGAGSIVAPMQIGPFGWMGIWTDPTGASFGCWQGLQHTGFQITNEPGAPTWCDLTSTDPTTSKAFYTSVFGFGYTPIGMDGADYDLFTVPGAEMPAGGLGADASASRSVWSVCFESADVDASARVVADSGGTVLREPWDFEFGRLVACAGPDGEEFSLITSRPEPNA
jgi:predicted enzyme related to lactoylglutathione lyase